MASLYNTRISDTYVSIIKSIDNAVISSTLKQLSDGSGNGLGIYVNTSGDFKVSGILEFGSLKDTAESITITKFVDEADGIANNDNDTTIPTSAAVKDYVDTQITAEDLDFAGDTGSGSVDLDSQVLTISGTTNEIETSASGQTLTIGLPSSISVNLVGNVTGDVTGDLTGNVTATSVLADGVTATTQASNDNSTKVATTAYVDAQVTAEDLDFSGDSGSGSVDLDSQTFSIIGTTNEIETSAGSQQLQIGLPSTISVNVTGNVTGNLTGDVTGDLTGSILTASQTNITSVGTLTSLSVSGNATVSSDLILSDYGSGTHTGTATQRLGVDSSGNVIEIPIGAGAVDGSGTANTVTMWSDTDTITDAPITISGNNVNLSSGSSLYFGSTSVGITGNASGADYITFRTNANERARFDSSGRLGLGTSSPDGNLEVIASTVVSGASDTVNNVLIGLQSANRPTIILDTADTTYTNRTWNITNVGSLGSLAIGRNGLDVMVMDNNGNSTFAGYVTLESANPIYFLKETDQSADNKVWGIQSETSLLKIRAFNDALSSATDALTFTRSADATFGGDVTISGGDLTIGTDSLAGNINSVGDVLAFDVDSNTGGANPSIQFKVSNSEKMRLDSSGRLGLGVTNPSSLLSVGSQATHNNPATTVNIATNDTGSYLMKVTSTEFNADGNWIGIGLGYSNNYMKMGIIAEAKDNNGRGKLHFAVNTTAGSSNASISDAKITIDNSGNVGIGTSSPASGLQVAKGSSTIPTAGASTSSACFGNASSDDNYGVVLGAAGSGVGYISSQRTDGTATTYNLAIQPNGGLVGIGTDSPSNNLQVKTESNGGGITIQRNSSSTGAFADLMFSISTSDVATPETKIRATRGSSYSDTDISFITSNTERARITSGGDVGISNTSPSAKLHIGSGSSALISGSADELMVDNAGNSGITIGTGASSVGSLFFADSGSSASGYVQYNHSSNALIMGTEATERMRITSGGDVLVGTTGAITTGNGFSITNTGQVRIGRASTGTIKQIIFSNPNGEVGSVSTSGSATAYNTSSDYRLKEDLQDFNALEIASKIKMYDFKWKADDSRSYGVMAHELKEVLPQAVTGEKDGEEMQGVDYSKLVPILLKSIQELKAEIDELKNNV